MVILYICIYILLYDYIIYMYIYILVSIVPLIIKQQAFGPSVAPPNSVSPAVSTGRSADFSLKLPPCLMGRSWVFFWRIQ